jgi:hypothetical protein
MFSSAWYIVKKSAPFFNLTLDFLLNLQEKYYQCINFGAKKLEPKRVPHLRIFYSRRIICIDAELRLLFRHYYSWIS